MTDTGYRISNREEATAPFFLEERALFSILF